MKHITESLIENSKSAMIGCVELHNKPVFSYRYEICTILAINAWELLLKAYIAENHQGVKLIRKDGTTKPFDECVAFASSGLGKSFRTSEENIKKLYEYRNHIIHFYKDPIEIILFSLLHKTVLLYCTFLKEQFNDDLSDEANLILLPIGFKPISCPIDFLSKYSEISESSRAVRQFVKSIVTSTNSLEAEGIEESIISKYNIAVINANRVTNADIIAGIAKDGSEATLGITKVIKPENITDDDNAKKIQIEERTLFKTLYVFQYRDILDYCRKSFSEFKQNAEFNRVMKTIKGNPSFHKKRYLNVVEKTGQAKDWYTHAIFAELSKYYALRSCE